MAPIIDKSWYVRIPSAVDRIAAGGVVVRLERNDVMVAFAREGHFAEFVLPKGGVHEGETVERAARREIEEETGLSDVHLIKKLGIRERLSFDKKRWQIVHYFLYRTSQREGTPRDAEKHFGVWWFPVDSLPDMLWPEQRELIETEREEIVGNFSGGGT
jgi:ADP-ribose pyrophosphatase YjhB (NUDIX family)